MTSSVQELYIRIVAAETTCSFHEECNGFEFTCIDGKVSVNGQVHYPCAVCNGTGKVAVLPWLRELCTVGHPHPEKGWVHSKDFVWDCPGWQAKPLSLETVMAALRTARLRYEITYDAFGNILQAAVWGRTHEASRSDGDTELEALLLATAKAIGVSAQ